MNVSVVGRIATLAITLLMAPSTFADQTATVQVSGTMDETIVEANLRNTGGLHVTSFDTFYGDLAGTGILHVYSTEFVDPVTELNVISTRKISTADGHLFLSEVGHRIGSNVDVVSTVTGGTGIFKDSTGGLILHGAVIEGVGVHFTYNGSITFK